MVAPVLVPAVGYFPGWLMGGEDMPGPAFLEWTRWCMHPEFIFGDPTLTETGYLAQFRAPIRFAQIEDDVWGTPPAVRGPCQPFHGQRRSGPPGASASPMVAAGQSATTASSATNSAPPSGPPRTRGLRARTERRRDGVSPSIRYITQLQTRALGRTLQNLKGPRRGPSPLGEKVREPEGFGRGRLMREEMQSPPHQLGRMTYGRTGSVVQVSRTVLAPVSHGLASSPQRGEGRLRSPNVSALPVPRRYGTPAIYATMPACRSRTPRSPSASRRNTFSSSAPAATWCARCRTACSRRPARRSATRWRASS